MSQPKIGLSMLYTLSESFAQMTQQLKKVQELTHIIEVVDDGTHQLDNNRVAILAETAKTYDIKFSVHAPFADINVASPSKTMRIAALRRLKQSMQHAADLGAYLWVLHPGGKSGISAFYPGEDWKQNEESIVELHDTASDLGLQVAMENLPEKYMFLMKTPEDFQRFYKETGITDIGIVLDTGHAYLEGQIQPFLQQMPNKIVHIHVSDNHGIIDEHLGLGHGKINWQAFTKTLKATGFSGTILAESVYNVEETVQRLKQLFA
jgi:sugar phosphate isomerase/epimerase